MLKSSLFIVKTHENSLFLLVRFGFESLIVHQKMLISHRNGHFFYPFYPIFVSFVHFYPPFGGYFLLFSSFWGINWGINWGIKSATFSLDFPAIFNMHTTIFSLHKANIHLINRYTVFIPMNSFV